MEAARGTLAQRNDAGVDPSLLAYTLSLPTEGMIADVLPAGSIDPTAIHVAREFLLAEISRQLRSELLATLRENSAVSVTQMQACDECLSSVDTMHACCVWPSCAMR